MHDTTMQMGATTAQMAATTAQMNQNTKSMKATTENMNGVMTEIFDAGRQGAALDLRSKQWELLLQSKKLEDKGTYAGLYFLAFEFQLWSNLGRDARPNERERLMQDAVDEFFRRLVGITHWAAEELDPFAGKNPLKFGEVENEKASFNALAGSIEKNNRKQEIAQEEAKSESISMLKLLETALRAGKEIREGRSRLTDFPEYVNIVLQREELAYRLLRARHQVMGLAVLGYLTPMTRTLTEGFKYKYLGQKWDLDFNQLNESQIRLASFRLKEAIEARDFLAEMGWKSELDSTIKRIFSHARVVNAPGERGARTSNLQSPMAQLQIDLIGKLRDYTKE